MSTIFETLKQKGASARIAVMRYRFIGDTLLTVPFLKTLRHALPDAQIDVLVSPNSGEVLEHCPYLNQLIYWDTSRKHRYENPDNIVERPQNFWQSVHLLKQGQYDAVFVLKRSFSSALLSFLAGIPIRAGFNTEGRGFLLTQRTPYEMNRHEASCYLDILHNCGFPAEYFPATPTLDIWLSPEEEQKAFSALQQALGGNPPRKNIVLHLTSSNHAKEWPLPQAKLLLDWLLDQSGYHVHFVGAKSDAEQYEALCKNISVERKTRLHNWCGQFSIRESCALLKQMDLVVGVDSGTLHMARAVHTPTIVLFGPMSELKWNPPGAVPLTHPMACHPCHLKSPCHHEFACIRHLSPESVIEQCKILLKA